VSEFCASGAPRNASTGNRFVSGNVGIIGKAASHLQAVITHGLYDLRKLLHAAGGFSSVFLAAFRDPKYCGKL
jgi:hypothetical protein